MGAGAAMAFFFARSPQTKTHDNQSAIVLRNWSVKKWGCEERLFT